MLELFKPYERKGSGLTDDIKLPEEILGADVHYMVYLLCDGDVTKKNWVQENLDIVDFYEWMLLGKYKSYCETEGMNRKQGKGKTINNFKGF